MAKRVTIILTQRNVEDDPELIRRIADEFPDADLFIRYEDDSVVPVESTEKISEQTEAKVLNAASNDLDEIDIEAEENPQPPSEDRFKKARDKIADISMTESIKIGVKLIWENIDDWAGDIADKIGDLF